MVASTRSASVQGYKTGMKPHTFAPRPGTHIAALDGIRGLAILLVLVFHFAAWSGRPSSDTAANLYLRLASLGWMGVDLFFVLSGFLITGILLDTRDSPHYYRSFYGRRTLRIAPIYYGLLAVLFVLAPLLAWPLAAEVGRFGERPWWLWCYATNIGQAVRGRWPFEASWLDLNHLWSLAVEEHFYLVWPALVRVCGPARLGWACGGCIVVAPLIRTGMAVAGCHPIGAYVLTPCRMDALALGGLLALWSRGQAVESTRRALGTALAASGLVLAGLVVLMPGGGPSPQSLGMRTVGYSALAAAAGGAVLLAGSAAPGGPWHRFWTSAPLRVLGKYSYGVYLYHHAFGRGLEPYLHRALADSRGVVHLPGLLLIAALGTAAALAVAAVSYHLVESPFLRLKRFFPVDARAVRPPRPASERPAHARAEPSS
jgi:peptidoglycan/LPS O-acetylase OafA/YrhL